MAENEETQDQGETPEDNGAARGGMDPEIRTLNKLMKTFAEMGDGQRSRALFMLASRFCPSFALVCGVLPQIEKTDG
jgi:hypothetical protein